MPRIPHVQQDGESIVVENAIRNLMEIVTVTMSKASPATAGATAFVQTDTFTFLQSSRKKLAPLGSLKRISSSSTITRSRTAASAAKLK